MPATPTPGAPRPERHCLVTIGATARFTQLLREVLSPAFLDHLAADAFTHLTLQCGKDLAQVREDLLGVEPRPGLQIATFDFVDDLVPDMVLCRAADGGRTRVDGAVIAHAGTGTILDCLRVSAPLVVVPNPTLKDNHQEELAEEIQHQGYAIWGRLGQLDYALEQLDLLLGDNTAQFRPHPVPGRRQQQQQRHVDVWSVAGAMMDRARPAAGGDVSELKREEAAQMALD